MTNLHQLFVLYTASQIIGEFSQNYVAFLEYMNFNKTDSGISAKRHFHSLGGINPIPTTGTPPIPRYSIYSMVPNKRGVRITV